MKEEKIIIDKDGITLEKLTAGSILVFNLSREERIIKIDFKNAIVYTERQFLHEKEDPWFAKFEYTGNRIFPCSVGNVYKVEDSPRKIRPNREDRGELYGS